MGLAKFFCALFKSLQQEEEEDGWKQWRYHNHSHIANWLLLLLIDRSYFNATFAISVVLLKSFCVAFISIVDLLIYSETPSSFQANGISATISGNGVCFATSTKSFKCFNGLLGVFWCSLSNLNYRSTHVQTQSLSAICSRFGGIQTKWDVDGEMPVFELNTHVQWCTYASIIQFMPLNWPNFACQLVDKEKSVSSMEQWKQSQTKPKE